MTLRLGVVILLVLVGLAAIVVNGRKLVSDWPRPKPRHNVDLAWIQVYLGVAALVVAWVIARDPAHVLFEPTPPAVNPSAGSTGEGGR